MTIDRSSPRAGVDSLRRRKGRQLGRVFLSAVSATLAAVLARASLREEKNWRKPSTSDHNR
jgi:hypothetical protein